LSKLLLVQVLRALAALSIAMLHAQHDAGMLAERAGVSFTPLDRFPWAAGVDVFFVISGFIMVHASRGLFGTPEARGVFLVRRVARIVPLYWTVTTLYLAIALGAPAVLNSVLGEPWQVIASYFFIPYTRPDGAAQPLYSLGWTLNYEMFFYGLFALAIVLPRRLAVAALTAGLLALVLLGRLAPLPQPFAFWTDSIILEFAFGLGLGLLRAAGVTLRGPVRGALAVIAIVLLALDLRDGGSWGALPRALAWGGPAALLVAAAALGHDRAAGGLATRLGVAVGDASYALYLLHPFAIRGGRELAARTGLTSVVGPWGFVILALVAATLAALLVHRLFERPATEGARRRLEHWTQKWSPLLGSIRCSSSAAHRLTRKAEHTFRWRGPSGPHDAPEGSGAEGDRIRRGDAAQRQHS
jgi:exopolysaccharide production protein ExoZ